MSGVSPVNGKLCELLKPSYKDVGALPSEATTYLVEYGHLAPLRKEDKESVPIDVPDLTRRGSEGRKEFIKTRGREVVVALLS